MVNGFRLFTRVHNGIQMHLELDAWPRDLPLPDETIEMVTGEGPFHPFWRIELEPDSTTEIITGWFIVPNLSTEETFRWFQVEMAKLGWIETERSETLPAWAMLRYRHPESEENTETHVVISIRRNKYLNRTQPMLRRVTIHPWAPPEEEEAREAQGEAPPATEADVAETGAPEAASLPVEELAPAG